MTRTKTTDVEKELHKMGYSKEDIEHLDFATIDGILNGDYC